MPMCDLRAFDIVECVDDTPVLKESQTMPEAGHLYRIRSVRKIGNGYSVRLLELTPDCHLGGPCSCGHCGWDSGRFRLTHRPDKLAKFREMLNVKEAVRPVELKPDLVPDR